MKRPTAQMNPKLPNYPTRILSSSSLLLELSIPISMALALLISPLPPAKINKFTLHQPKTPPKSLSNRFKFQAVQETKEKSKPAQSSPDEVTQKYGLEVGLWKIFSSKSEGDGEEKSKTDQAKELLTKYGGAYLATSITLSLISFALCYALVSAGIDVQALLAKVGIAADETGGKVGTFALAYAAHKAASPIRFPPTVALTPIVAGWIGKKTDKSDK